MNDQQVRSMARALVANGYGTRWEGRDASTVLDAYLNFEAERLSTTPQWLNPVKQ